VDQATLIGPNGGHTLEEWVSVATADHEMGMAPSAGIEQEAGVTREGTKFTWPPPQNPSDWRSCVG
jgi:hypothetical protein